MAEQVQAMYTVAVKMCPMLIKQLVTKAVGIFTERYLRVKPKNVVCKETFDKCRPSVEQCTPTCALV